jgi:hypothetical protein
LQQLNRNKTAMTQQDILFILDNPELKALIEDLDLEPEL